MTKTRIYQRIEKYMNENKRGNEIQEERGRLSVNIPKIMKQMIVAISSRYKTSLNSLFLYIISEIDINSVNMKEMKKIRSLFWRSDKSTVSLSLPISQKIKIKTKCKNEGVSVSAMYVYITALYLDWYLHDETSEDEKQENIKDFKDFIK